MMNVIRWIPVVGLVIMAITGFVSTQLQAQIGGGEESLETCDEGCSEVMAEHFGNNCITWSDGNEMVANCTRDDYDLVVDSKEGPCVAVTPLNNIKHWQCTCHEKWQNSGEMHREMMGIEYSDISSKCTGSYTTIQQKDCVIGT